MIKRCYTTLWGAFYSTAVRIFFGTFILLWFKPVISLVGREIHNNIFFSAFGLEGKYYCITIYLYNTHWRIQGAPPAPPPQQDQFLSFSHMFLPKSIHIGGRRPPPQLVGAPQWEILDPPLNYLYHNYYVTN